MLDGLAGEIQGDERDDLNGLMCGDTKGAVGIDASVGVAVHRLYYSDHQNQRNTDDSNESYPCGARAQFR